MSFVQLSLEYFPDPTRGVPVYNGYIYVGEPDTDPEVVGNQKTVVLRLSDGSEVATAQPIRTGAGGVVLYDGSPTQLVVEGNYSIKVLDTRGTEVYYIQNAFGSSAPVDGLTGQGVLLADLKGLEGFADGVTIVTSGRTSFGDNGGGTWVFDSGDLSAKVTADPLSGVHAPPDLSPTGVDGAWVRRLPDGRVTPQMYGAITNADQRVAENPCESAIQAAIDSEYPVFFPAGFYYIENSIIINRPKIINFEGTIFETISTAFGASFPAGDSHARVYSHSDIDFFIITSHNVYIDGGVFDTFYAPIHNSAIFKYDFAADPRAPIWSGGINNFAVRGGYYHLISGPGVGTTAILFDFEAAAVAGSYITHCDFKGRIQWCRRGVYATPLDPTASQFANSCTFDLEGDGVQQMIALNTINDSKVKVKAQSRHNLDITEVDTAQVYINTDNIDIDFVGWDFDGSESGSVPGLYKGTHYIENHSTSTRLVPFTNQVSRVTSPLSTSSYWNPHVIDGAKGIIPRFQSIRTGGLPDSLFDMRTVVQSDLHNMLAGLHLKAASYSINAYQGDGIDFDTLVTDSATAAIPVSTDITITYEENLFSDTDVILPTTFTFNADAVAGSDYVEIYADDFEFLRAEMFWFAFGKTTRYFNSIQIIGISNSTPVFNKTLDITSLPNTEATDPVKAWRLMTGGSRGFNEIIIRLIGCNSAGSLGMYDIGCVNGRPRSEEGFFMRKYVDVQKYGGLAMMDRHFTPWKVSTANLDDATHIVNTSPLKVEGAMVFNTTSNKPIFAGGTANTSGWYDATGAVVHVPV